MDLYIGNATRQTFQFAYRIPESTSLRTQPIAPGTQEKISGDLSPEQVEAIIAQHAKYGLIKESDIDRAKAFHGTCYSIGKRITNTNLAYLMNRNMSHLVVQGEQIRKANAIAQNTNFERALTESGRPERVATLDLTVQQENHDPANDVPQFSVGTLVTRDGDAPRAPRSPGRANRRRAA